MNHKLWQGHQPVSYTHLDVYKRQAPLHHAIEHFAGQQSAVVAMILPTVLNLILGFIIGGIVVLGVKAVAKIRGQAH